MLWHRHREAVPEYHRGQKVQLPAAVVIFQGQKRIRLSLSPSMVALMRGYWLQTVDGEMRRTFKVFSRT